MTVTFASILISRPSRAKSGKAARGWRLGVMAGLFAAAVCATPTQADDIANGPATHRQAALEAGFEAARAGRFGDAIVIFNPHAASGHVMAHYGLGLIHSKDRGASLPASPNQAHHHFTRAAAMGHVGAIFELAFQYERGIGTMADMEKALKLYRIAAHHNHLNAQFNLAVLLSRSSQTKRDLREAYFWAIAAQHNARIRPRGALTYERVSKLARQIRGALPSQTARRATRAATVLTGQPI